MPKLQIAIAGTVGGVWAVVALYATFTRDPVLVGLAQTITAPLLGIVGWFGVGAFIKAKRGEAAE